MSQCISTHDRTCGVPSLEEMLTLCCVSNELWFCQTVIVSAGVWYSLRHNNHFVSIFSGHQPLYSRAAEHWKNRNSFVYIFDRDYSVCLLNNILWISKEISCSCVEVDTLHLSPYLRLCLLPHFCFMWHFEHFVALNSLPLSLSLQIGRASCRERV